MDEVDQIVDAWQRERPDLDVAPLHVLSRVSRLARQLDLTRRHAFTEHHLASWEFDVLAALRRAGDPYTLSAGQIANQTLVSSGTITNRVDRLEERGLVRRRPDPNDRRGVLVQLTTAGMSAVDGALTALLEHERELLDGLTLAQQRDLARLLRALGRTMP